MSSSPQDIEELVENACSALWSLSMEDENIEIMRDENVISMLIAAIKQHNNAPKVHNACKLAARVCFNARGDTQTRGYCV